MSKNTPLKTGYVVFNPRNLEAHMPTFSSNRQDAILKAGCGSKDSWNELRSLGFTTTKISLYLASKK